CGVHDGNRLLDQYKALPRCESRDRRTLRLNESPGTQRMPGAFVDQLSAHFMRGCRRAPLIVHPTPIASGSLCKIAHSMKKAGRGSDRGQSVYGMPGAGFLILEIRSSSQPMRRNSITLW